MSNDCPKFPDDESRQSIDDDDPETGPETTANSSEGTCPEFPDDESRQSIDDDNDPDIEDTPEDDSGNENGGDESEYVDEDGREEPSHEGGLASKAAQSVSLSFAEKLNPTSDSTNAETTGDTADGGGDQQERATASLDESQTAEAKTTVPVPTEQQRSDDGEVPNKSPQPANNSGFIMNGLTDNEVRVYLASIVPMYILATVFVYLASLGGFNNTPTPVWVLIGALVLGPHMLLFSPAKFSSFIPGR